MLFGDIKQQQVQTDKVFPVKQTEQVENLTKTPKSQPQTKLTKLENKSGALMNSINQKVQKLTSDAEEQQKNRLK